ncbi:unnamed protein product, partial [Discosporangium mesarthrocarpum]
FHLEQHAKVAIKMLSLDPNLAKVHARLISRMPEEVFWCNYFGRIAVIRAEGGMEPLCDDNSSELGPHSADFSGGSSDGFVNMSHSDAHSLDSSPSEKVTIGQDLKTGEVSHDLTLADRKSEYSDLGDLDDLKDTRVDSDIDAELEAEIAAELGDDAADAAST